MLTHHCAQAVTGAKAYEKTCAGCHGAKLQGDMGPALVGRQFWLAYGGKKVSTLWAAVHTQMLMMSPGSLSVKNSINTLSQATVHFVLARRQAWDT